MVIVFLGTPAFAVPSLERVANNVAAVYTQPDRPRGRGQEIAMPAVKEAALRLGLPVHQPPKIRGVVEELRQWKPDLMIVVGYGQIIPQAILDIPPLGIINVHASLLPKYRGAAPIQWAIARGETHTGVTTMRINAGLDTGDMLLKSETEIGADETAVELKRPAGGCGRGSAGANTRRVAADYTAAAGRFTGDAGADPDERRWTNRVGAAGAGNRGSHPGISAVAGGLHVRGWKKTGYLESARGGRGDASR